MRLPPLALAALGLAFVACSDVRENPVPADELFPPSAVQDDVQEPITYASSEQLVYGLPRGDMSSIAELIAVLPQSATGVNDPDTFVGPGVNITTDQCRGGAPAVSMALPMVVEGVVTLHPRQYMKVLICGQDEKFYGSYTIEDDTGGIVVLRDSRVAPFTFGDRVRLTVSGVMLTFGLSPNTRAVLISDYEVLPVEQTLAGQAPWGTVLYQPLTESITDDSPVFTRTQQIEGWVFSEPTNDNFNSMVITSERIEPTDPDLRPTGAALQCALTCQIECEQNCADAAACDSLCRSTCIDDQTFDNQEFPACWQVGIDAELGRRKFAPEAGTHVRVTGPAVDSFDQQLWVISLGQVEVLAEPSSSNESAP
ncbi:MAG: hypothetical protein ACI81R_000551 [Bradymonadia bacterium]|jgi:hypothetical protein